MRNHQRCFPIESSSSCPGLETFCSPKCVYAVITPWLPHFLIHQENKERKKRFIEPLLYALHSLRTVRVQRRRKQAQVFCHLVNRGRIQTQAYLLSRPTDVFPQDGWLKEGFRRDPSATPGKTSELGSPIIGAAMCTGHLSQAGSQHWGLWLGPHFLAVIAP